MCLQPPLFQDIGKLCVYDFFCHITEILFANFKKKIQGFSRSRELSCDLFSTGGKQKSMIFEVFRAYLGEFSIFLGEICMVARSC